MLLSNFKISFISQGNFCYIDNPKDEQVFPEMESFRLIASTTENISEYHRQYFAHMMHYVYENDVRRYLLVNEGYMAAIGADIEPFGVAPYIVLHFCADEILVCLVAPKKCVLTGHQLKAGVPATLLALHTLTNDSFRSYLRKRHHILISKKEEKRIFALQNEETASTHVEIYGTHPFEEVIVAMLFDFNEWKDYLSSCPYNICKSIQKLLTEWSNYYPSGIYITGDFQVHSNILEMLSPNLSHLPLIVADNAESAVERGHAILQQHCQ